MDVGQELVQGRERELELVPGCAGGPERAPGRAADIATPGIRVGAPPRARVSGARYRRLLDLFYRIGVLMKGVDGLIELVAGTVLLFAPGLLHTLLHSLATRAAQDPTPVRLALAHVTTGIDHDLVRLGAAMLILFLLSHGVVKVVLVYCLLRRFHRAYPWAIAILSAFLAYQLYTVVVSPSVGLILLAVLDAVIIVLVAKEYRELRRDADARAVPAAPAAADG